MRRGYGVAGLLGLVIASLAFTTPGYSQDREARRVPPPYERPGYTAPGPQTVVGNGTTSFNGPEVYWDQYEYHYTGHRVQAGQNTSKQTFMTDTTVVRRDMTAEDGYFYCWVEVEHRGLKGQAVFELYKNGKRVARARGTFGGGSTPDAEVYFYRPQIKVSAGDELKCRIKLPKNNGIDLPNNTLVWSYSEYWDYWDVS